MAREPRGRGSRPVQDVAGTATNRRQLLQPCNLAPANRRGACRQSRYAEARPDRCATHVQVRRFKPAQVRRPALGRIEENPRISSFLAFPSDPMTRATISDTPPAIQAIDLFCGIGGLTHGLRLAGVNVTAGVDSDPACRHAFEANNGDAKFIRADVREVRFADLEPYCKPAGVTALVGCAPCQPHSAHTRRKTRSDADGSLVNEFARLVKEGTPDLVSMENVPGLARRPAFGELLQTLERLGYEVSTATVSCERYLVPQKRRRLVLLASRRGPANLPHGHSPPPTVGDCIGGLSAIGAGETSLEDPAHTALPLSPKNRERIAQSKPGGSWVDWEDRLVNECHRKAHYPAPYGRMRWDDLAPTITTQFCYYSTGRFGHPDQDRAISVREGALLQTFPQDYVLVDEEAPTTVRALARQVGNAVPVNLGTAIGTALVQALKEQ